ncbi:hypothetical protein DEO72_LG2g3428 [Vigna unguiculata]|uniref:Uncharacterized protein n=1 Tax=Vigna unguiculata TaxID=3917 RepID=A0A4D6L3P4_VIGUN|nr:hypothetical protein DEO72_LG2g3428 [Vigna unguiculata]
MNLMTDDGGRQPWLQSDSLGSREGTTIDWHNGRQKIGPFPHPTPLLELQQQALLGFGFYFFVKLAQPISTSPHKYAPGVVVLAGLGFVFGLHFPMERIWYSRPNEWVSPKREYQEPSQVFSPRCRSGKELTFLARGHLAQARRSRLSENTREPHCSTARVLT